MWPYVFIRPQIKHVRFKAGTRSATGIAFSSPNECARGGPTGGSTSPLIRRGAASAFMLRSNLLERASHFIWASHAPLPWLVDCGALCLSLYLLLFLAHSPLLRVSRCHKEPVLQATTRDERTVRAANVILMDLFGLTWLWFIATRSRCPPRCLLTRLSFFATHSKMDVKVRKRLGKIITTALKASLSAKLAVFIEAPRETWVEC